MSQRVCIILFIPSALTTIIEICHADDWTTYGWRHTVDITVDISSALRVYVEIVADDIWSTLYRFLIEEICNMHKRASSPAMIQISWIFTTVSSTPQRLASVRWSCISCLSNLSSLAFKTHVGLNVISSRLVLISTSFLLVPSLSSKSSEEPDDADDLSFNWQLWASSPRPPRLHSCQMIFFCFLIVFPMVFGVCLVREAKPSQPSPASPAQPANEVY